LNAVGATGTPGPALVIKSVRDIPRWFDPKKYDALAALDLPGWGRQIPERLQNRASAEPQTITLDALMAMAEGNLLAG